MLKKVRILKKEKNMWMFRRKGRSGFSSSTAEEVAGGIDASGLTAIVTGASGGVGAETTRVLALRCVHVIMGVRNMAAGQEVKEAIIKEIPAAKFDVMRLDLSSMASVEKYNRYYAYFQSKIANILHANQLARRLKEDGVEITANSVHPGVITTNIFCHLGCFEGVLSCLGKYVFKNLQQGASATCYVALHPQVRGISGEYFEDNNLSKASSKARDVDLARRLWGFSMSLVK